MSLLIEFWEFTRHKKKIWLYPVLLLLVVAGFGVVATESTILSAFIYAMFGTLWSINASYIVPTATAISFPIAQAFAVSNAASATQ